MNATRKLQEAIRRIELDNAEKAEADRLNKAALTELIRQIASKFDKQMRLLHQAWLLSLNIGPAEVKYEAGGCTLRMAFMWTPTYQPVMDLYLSTHEHRILCGDNITPVNAESFLLDFNMKKLAREVNKVVEITANRL